MDLRGPLRERIVAASEMEATSVVSFDVFDTALARPFLKPAALFRYISDQARDISGLVNLDFASHRTSSESAIRNQIAKRQEQRDPTLEEIYAELARRLNLTPATALQLMRTEIDAEMQLSFAIPALLDIYEHARALGKRIIFCSDTYLSHDVIVQLLQRSGYEGFERVFVSSEIGCTKRHGNIFSVLAKELDVAPGEILHLGDNLTSDVNNAERAGLKYTDQKPPRSLHEVHEACIARSGATPTRSTCHFNHFLRSRRIERAGRRSRTKYRSHCSAGVRLHFGYYAVGPLLYALVTWMRRRADQFGIDHIYFLSRDGHLPLLAWNLLGLSNNGGPQASYLHTLDARSCRSVSILVTSEAHCSAAARLRVLPSPGSWLRGSSSG